MKDNRRRRVSALATILLGAMAVVMTLGLMAPPAKAQTTSTTTNTAYPIIQPAQGTTTTTTAAPRTTTTVKHGGLAFTGADITMTVGASAIALGAGGVLVLASRKRKADR